MNQTSSLSQSKPLRKEPCPECRKNGADKSGDNLVIYDDGHGYCFACGYTYFPDTKEDTSSLTTDTAEYTFEYLPWRGVSKETMAFFGVQTAVDTAGKPTHLRAPFLHGVQNRLIEAKKFWSEGDMSTPQLFGSDKFKPTSARAITITEGWLDTLSVYEMLGTYPVVSVRSASSARADCKAMYEFLNSFDRIYLCFDNDAAGQKAKTDVASLFPFNKVYDVKLLSHKDANDYLTNDGQKEFKNAWFNAQRFLPEGVVSSRSAFKDLLLTKKKEAIATYPFKTLQAKTYGIRTGEAVLFTALEGIGKTEIIRAIEYHLLKTTKENIGIIHLEEDKSRILHGIVGYELQTPAHLPDSQVSIEEAVKALDSAIGKDDRVHLYTHFGTDDPDVILEVIRFLVAVCECKFIFLDHITWLATSQEEGDERKKLDYISTRLIQMVQDYDFALFFVSHINDDGKTRGSRNIGKVANIRVDLSRDLTTDNEELRNTTYLTISKNRFCGDSGPAGKLLFNRDTFTVSEKEEEVPF